MPQEQKSFYWIYVLYRRKSLDSENKPYNLLKTPKDLYKSLNEKVCP